jgi:long-chain acyl-CoA synthetase
MLYNNLSKFILHSTSIYASRTLIHNPFHSYLDLRRLSDNYLWVLQNNNVKKGERICAVEDKSINWIALMLASWRNGNIFVPLANNYNNEQYNKIIKKVDPVIIFNGTYYNETDNYLDKKVSDIRIINDYTNKCDTFMNDPALILFTSGSTNDPKGVVLTHHNIKSNLDMIDKLYNTHITEKDTSYSLLPWNHCYGLVCELLYLIMKGGSFYITDQKIKTPQEKFKDLRSKSPTLVYTVPKMLETIYRKRINLVDYCVPKSVKRKLVFGDNIRMISVGGSKCNPELIEYFDRNYGIQVYQGYGMTETSPMISLNSIENNNVKSVGRLLSGVDIKFSENKEIFVKGDNLMLGYLDNIDDNIINICKPFDNGYFNTGDIGYLDDDNYLYINGRSKAAYKLLNGKYINPSHIESVLGVSSYIDQIFVYGDGCDYNKCLIYVNKDIKIKSNIKKLILDDIKKISENRLENYEIPRELQIIEDPFTIDNGCLSNKLDYKRDYIMKKFNL